MVHFAEKPEKFVSNLINCGVYLFSSEMYKLDCYSHIAEKYQKIIAAEHDDAKNPLEK